MSPGQGPKIPVRLRVIDEKGFEKTELFNKSLLRIGSGPEAHLQLPDSGIDPCHVVILREGGVFMFANTSKKAKLLLNGREVSKGNLEHGDVLSFGKDSAYRIVFMTKGERSEDSREDSLRSLLAASRAINSSLVLSDVLERVMDSVMEVTGAERGFLMLREADGTLRAKVSRNIEPVALDQEMIPASRSIIEKAIEARKSVQYLANAVPGGKTSLSTSIVRLNLQTALCAPIVSKDEVIGVVYVDHRKALPDFSGREQEIIEGLADHASVAINNARLSERMLMSERLSAVGRMVSCMVHDLRGPLTGIRAAAEALGGDGASPRQKKMSRLIVDEADRMANMAREILEFCKGRITLNLSEVRLGEFLSASVDSLRSELEASGITLEIDLESAAEVRLDRDRMERVVRNLIFNAMEAMPDGGTLHIRSRTAGEEVELSVEDSGAGMSPAIRERALEPFFTSGKESGTGLGMAIAQQVIEAHGGRLGIESEQGKGTTVTLRFPVEGRARTAPAQCEAERVTA